jgi:Mg2+ and Co2+ transporter CorA
MNDDIVQRIDKLISGWEREYGVINKTMVDAMQTIIELKDQNRILIETIRVAADQIEMTKAQLLIRGDLIEKLKSGPGGIMEMKQTIADKEDLIDELLRTNWEKSWPTMRKYDTFEEYKDSVLK